MGAEFNFAKLKARDDQAASAEAEGLITQAAWDSGHGGYTGSFAECNGVIIDRGIIFDGVAEAEAWLDENAGKWGPMVIVQVKDGSYCAGAWCSS